MELAVLKMILDIAVVPVLLFAYKMNRDVEEIKRKLDSLASKIEGYENSNREEHKQLGNTLHELDKRNSVEHAQLGLK